MMKPPTDEQLIAASKHLLYEVEMYRSCCRSLPHQAKEAATNAILESFLLHVRNVHAFFLDDQKQQHDDVLAIHFVDAEEWKRHTQKWRDSTVIDRKRIHKDLAYLTYDRQKRTAQTKGWDCTQIAKELDDILSEFLGRTPQTLLHPDWQQVAVVQPEYPAVSGVTTGMTSTSVTYPG